MIWIQGDDHTWLEAAWDDDATISNPEGWREAVDAARDIAHGDGYPGRPNVVRAYCEGCERYSRPVRKPTAADKLKARERCGKPHAVIWPDSPPGWEYGCPRCDR
jgi:hypothetical protein